jgi:DNA-binding transcriptional LysR family regulator
MITTQLSLMEQINLKGFASAPLPFETVAVPMYMVWHKRDHRDPASQWLRESVKAFVDQLLPG